MTKKEIREIYSEKRKLLSDDVMSEMTAVMTEYFDKMKLSNIQAVLSYSPIDYRKEFNVRLCESLLQKNHPGIKIAHPRIVHNGGLMEAVVISNETLFIDNNYFIKEPSQGDILTPESFNLVLAPLLAFDLRGYRVGYGKGFYDRWLAQCRPGTAKIGFSFFNPLDTIDDINEFDVPLNLCITPTRVYEF